MKPHGTNKFNLITNIIAMSLFAALAMPLVSSAQEEKKGHHHYKLVDIGTLGGPNSFFSGPELPILNNRGAFAIIANTSVPNPNPGCFLGLNPPDCFVEHAAVWHNGTLTDLGVLPGGANSQTTSISASGLIDGFSENGLIDPQTGQQEIVAVLFAGNKTIDLGTLPGGTESLATNVNSRGQVAGFSNNDVFDPFSIVGFPTQTRTFLWQNGVMKDLGTLGGPDAAPNAMNERGQIAGFSYTNTSASTNCAWPLTTAPFLWENGKMRDLGTLGGTCGYALWINQLGQVVGTSNLAGDASHHAFVWDDGKMTDVGTLGGNNSEGDWMSDSGYVVGRADLPGSQFHHGYRWKDGVMTDLGTLSTWPCSTALSVNSIGQVVGETGICGIGGGPAFLSENGGPIVDVNALIVPTSDIEVVSEFDINERGEIAGIGVVPSGDEHAVLLIPCDDAHPNVAGCDYGPVNATTASLLASAPTTTLKMSPSEVKARFRSLMERRYTHFGNLQTSPK
jgi:probable HAF family extracellular repeat protein